MSRVILKRHPDNSEHVTVGWDHPARGAFWQEWASREEVTEAEKLMEKAERTGIGPHSQTVSIVETGVKRDGGMWPGIALDKFRDSVPEDLRSLVTDKVMELLKQHSLDADSGYTNALTDLSHNLS